MVYKIVRSEEEFIELKDQWNALLDANNESTCYNSFELSYNWYKKVVPDCQLVIVCVIHNENIVGIAPLCIRKQAKFKVLNFSQLEILGWGDYKTFLYDQSFLSRSSIFKTFFDAIESIRGEWDKLVLKNLRHDTYLAYFLKKTPYHQHLFSYNEAPYIDLKKYEGYSQYMAEFRDKRIDANEKRLKKKSPFRFEFFHSVSDELLVKLMDCHINEKLVLNQSSWERTSPFSNTGRKEFHMALLTEGNFSVAATLLDEEDNVIAYEIMYRHNGIYYCWNIGYNPKYSSFGVARILNKKVVEFLFNEANARRYDYGAGGYRWKYQNTNQFQVLYRLEMHNLNSSKVKLLNRLRR